MPLLIRVNVTAAKQETSIGTAESLSGTDAAFNIFDCKFAPDITMIDREGQGGFDFLSSIPGGRKCRVTFKTYLQWDGTATEPSWADTFLPACGWVKSGQVFTPRSDGPGSNVKTLTFGGYLQGIKMLVAGAVGTFKVTLESGQPSYIEWDFMGAWNGVTDASILTPAYPTANNLRWANGVGTWNSVALKAGKAVIDAGNNIMMRDDPSTSSGYISGLITSRRPTVDVDPEAVTVATQDRWLAWLSSTENALALHCGGATNELLQFDAPKAQVLSNAIGDREKLATETIKFGCNKNGSTHDESLKITFTAAS